MNNEERILSLIENGFHLNKPDLDYIRQLSLKAKAWDLIKPYFLDISNEEYNKLFIRLEISEIADIYPIIKQALEEQ